MVDQNDVFQCVMQEYMGFSVGLIVGTVFSVKTKKLHHLMLSSTLGAGFDLVYATSVKCKPMIEEYRLAMEHAEKALKELEEEAARKSNENGPPSRGV
jgi:hypothetical protein